VREKVFKMILKVFIYIPPVFMWIRREFNIVPKINVIYIAA